MAFPYNRIPGRASRRLDNAVPGVRGGRGIHGWQAGPARLRWGKRLELLALATVLVFAIAVVGHLALLSSGSEIAGVELAAKAAGGVAFLVAHLVPPVVDGITGGRARLALWSVLAFWITLGVLVGGAQLL